MTAKIALVPSLMIFACGLFVADVHSQSCAMQIRPISAESETMIKGASATAVRLKNSRLYSSRWREGMPYFANLPSGEYRVTVRKAKVTRVVGNLKHSCADAVDGTNTAYISMWPPKMTHGVDVGTTSPPVRRNIYTVLGSEDRSMTPGPPPAQTGGEVPDQAPVRKVPKVISGGVLNGKATSLPRPVYPPPAYRVKAGGSVAVQVLVDEEGKVISASAVSGHPLLRSSAESAARQAIFSPTRLSGQLVKVSGVIVYNF